MLLFLTRLGVINHQRGRVVARLRKSHQSAVGGQSRDDEVRRERPFHNSLAGIGTERAAVARNLAATKSLPSRERAAKLLPETRCVSPPSTTLFVADSTDGSAVALRSDLYQRLIIWAELMARDGVVGPSFGSFRFPVLTSQIVTEW